MSPIPIVHPRHGRDLETDLRHVFDTTAATSIFVPLRKKLFEAWKRWRVDVDPDTWQGTYAIDGYDIEMHELSGADKRIALHLLEAA